MKRENKIKSTVDDLDTAPHVEDIETSSYPHV